MIEVVDYDPEWPQTFERLRALYSEAMAHAGVPVVSIEHVGSTSVPGLAAKPVIDVDIIVAASHVESASEALIGLGFEPLGELGIPERWAFSAPVNLPRTNTYVTVEGCLSLRNHLAVRDALRSREDLRDEYAAVKRSVGETARDIAEYGSGKNAIVQRILEAAGITAGERDAIDSAQLTLMRAAGVAILDEQGRLLLGRHAHDGRWATFGGAVERRETPEEAARREVREEVGLELGALVPLGSFGGSEIYDVVYANGAVQRYDVTMFATVIDESAALPDGQEILAARWFDESEIASADLATDMTEIVPAAFDWFRQR